MKDQLFPKHEFTQIGDPESPVEDTLTLPYERRQKRRQRIVLDQGIEAALILEHNERPAVGSVLQTAEGYCVRVIAALEDISMVVADDAWALARASYHLGNRHVAVQINSSSISVERDHVLDEMIRGLGLTVVHELATFEPETGAYAKQQHSHHGDDHTPTHSRHE